MMLDVTTYVEGYDMSQFSDSINNSGLQNIGEITWNNAVKHVAAEPLLTAEQQQEARDYLDGFGADWDMQNMPDNEVEALLLQFIAGDISEYEMFDTYDEYEKAASAGQVSSRLTLETDGRWYYYVGE